MSEDSQSVSSDKSKIENVGTDDPGGESAGPRVRFLIEGEDILAVRDADFEESYRESGTYTRLGTAMP